MGWRELESSLKRSGANDPKRVVPFLTVGFPDMDATMAVVPALERAGAAALELGVPFSDPLAEGPTIQRSSEGALAQGVTLSSCLDTAAALRERGVEMPLVLMGYYNPFLAYGLEEVAAAAASVGVDGFIVPDLPVEEHEPFLDACLRHELGLVPLLAPTSTDARIDAACASAHGFIYCVSLLGVTGARNQTLPEAEVPHQPRPQPHRQTPRRWIRHLPQSAGGCPAGRRRRRRRRQRLGGPHRVISAGGTGVQGARVSDGPGGLAQTARREPLMAMMCRGFRGATTASDNTSMAIVEATEELLRAMVEANDLDPEYIAAAWFTTTTDLTAEFPATVARRRLGWTGVALMNSHEIDVPGGQPMCIRVMLLVNTEKRQDEIQNIYLRGAVNLRQRNVQDD